MQAKLCSLFAYCKPGSLDVFDIGQHDPANGDHPDIFFGSCKVMNAPDPGEQGIYILEGPGNKGKESLRMLRFPRLYFTDAYQVFKAFTDGFNVAEHHGGRSSNIQLMRLVHDSKPFISTALSFGDQPAHPVHKNLSTSAWK